MIKKIDIIRECWGEYYGGGGGSRPQASVSKFTILKNIA